MPDMYTVAFHPNKDDTGAVCTKPTADFQIVDAMYRAAVEEAKNNNGTVDLGDGRTITVDHIELAVFRSMIKFKPKQGELF